MERNSINPVDTKIGQAVPYSALIGWESEDGLSTCSRCGVGPDSRRYPADEVMVVRHYKTNSTAGTWIWL